MSTTESSVGEARHVRRNTVYGEIYDPAEDREKLPEPKVTDEAEIQKLIKKVQTTSFLKEIDRPRLRAALSHMSKKEVKAGTIVIKQGDPGDHFYIIESGKFEAYINDKLANTYDGDGNFGELALLYNEPRAATVKAVTDGVLWEIDRRLYTRVVVRMAYQRRQNYQRFLESVPLLACVEPYERLRLCDAFETKEYEPKEVIMRIGDAPEGMYFIEEGQVEVVNKDGGSAVYKVNMFFGEEALISTLKRKKTATAITKVRCAFLDTGSFERLLGKCIDIMKRDTPQYQEHLKEYFAASEGNQHLRTG